MKEEKELLQAIEKLRHEMNQLVQKQGEINAEVIKKSQELDILLNKYQQIRKKKEQ